MQKQFLDYFQNVSELSLKKKSYQSLLDELFHFLVRNDHVQEDVTVQTFLANSIRTEIKKGIISAKTSCVIAGVEEVVYLCKKHTKLIPNIFVIDGESVKPGADILSLKGSAEEILAYERAILNILQRMSGIATETGKYVEMIKELRLKNPPVIAATRKTPWMHIDKKAVAIGGGVTHRLDLQDGILLKDNHLELIQQEYSLKNESEAVVYAIEHAVIADEEMVIEIEVKTDEAAFAAVESFRSRKLSNPCILLLDNFTATRAKKVIQKIKATYATIAFEASGGITIENIAQFAKTGVDVISVGALTHSPKASDLSVDIV
jgi:nicotinate-nucleotide pyrophosphorylase (carboxylating)